MIASLLIIGIVISSPPPPPAPSSPQQQDCKYSAMVGGDRSSPIYECFSQSEWDARNAQIATDQAKQDAEISAFWSAVPAWLLKNWWKILLWIVGIVIGFIVAMIAYDTIDQKLRPYRYDKCGFKIDRW